MSKVGKTWFCKSLKHKVYIDCAEMANITSVEAIQIAEEYL
jgi:hypothetical protein